MNKAILMGRLTRDPEVRYTQSNLTVSNFTLAIDRRFVRQGEERQADFIPIVTFGKTAEFCEKYFKKGQQVLVVGRIQTRSWDDNEGKKRYMTEVVSEEVYFADSRRQDGDGGRGDDYGFYPQAQQGGGAQYSSASAGAYGTRPGGAAAGAGGSGGAYGAQGGGMYGQQQSGAYGAQGASPYGQQPPGGEYGAQGASPYGRAAGGVAPPDGSGGPAQAGGEARAAEPAGLGTASGDPAADPAGASASGSGGDGFTPIEDESDLPF
jgi:single-strand DNA-binding protein